MSETNVYLDKFKFRSYQIPVADALENKKIKRLLICWPRRAGKDLTAFNLCVRQCLKRVGTIFYVFPTFSSGRRILWDAVTNDGRRIIDFIPPELIESKNEMMMRIRFVNGSQICIVGSDNYDQTLVGVNAMGIVFSEFALSDPMAYQFARPILTANDGWALFCSTPRGKNHFYDLFQIAMNNPQHWFCERLTVNDTKHIDMAEIQKELDSGEMSEDLIQQEYFCEFSRGIEGAYYSSYIDRMRLKDQIGEVPWEASHPVHTAWDIGVRDACVILMFQMIGHSVKIIDTYSNSKMGLEHYIKILGSKPYNWGRHIAPHDIAVKEFGSGMTRLEKARNLGINFIIAPRLSIEDGIESVRSLLSKVWIDQRECKTLIKAIENYRQEYDHKNKIYSAHPLHDWSSNWCDALRYLAITAPRLAPGTSAEELDKRYKEAKYGDQNNLPHFFRDNNGY